MQQEVSSAWVRLVRSRDEETLVHIEDGLSMKKAKREVSYDGNTYKVRSDTIEIPDFTQMERMAVLMWMCRHTYGRGYSKPNPLQGLNGAISLNNK